jgi:hypothetical protein
MAIACGVVAVVLGAGSQAVAGKPPKCVNPGVVFDVADAAGLASDGDGAYTDGASGVYAKMNSCAGTGDVVLSLDVAQRTMSVTLSDAAAQVADRVDVTGVGLVGVGVCEFQNVTIWFSGGFLKANGNNGSSQAQVCGNSDGSWTVTSQGQSARFKLKGGRYVYTNLEAVAFELTVR